MVPLEAMASCCFAAFTLFSPVTAQSVNNPVNACYAAMAGTGTAVPGIWSGFQNQAGLAYIRDLSLSIHYENHFIIPENSIKALTVDIPVTQGTIAVSYSFFGYSKYFESRACLAFGKTFGDHLSAGIQLNYLMIGQSADYGNMHTVVPEGGILIRPMDKLYIGFHLFNPARQHFPQDHDQTIPSVMQIGFGYRIVDQVLLCAEAEKATLEKQVWKAGFEYEMIRNLNLRLGISSAEMSRYAIGLGYTFCHFTLDFALSHHQWLGFTPYVTLTWVRRRDKGPGTRDMESKR
jgi:hypothetical protein